ncbi:hypothetical protein [Actinomadura rubrisoli]|uniref:Uncharacterized protein n=1 Tax=Actinomadura rubrisoli TaxID=2530368 RepID=A0A4V6PEM3_9ACTN|nr:hypothetical protein [Actinomadura rubrisoli]TDD74307.1 hypothetical protein E1298_32685 [Actinomadura rubrisoli]
MADLYEVLVTADLPDDVSASEVAELRWHLGLGPQPTRLTIVTDYDEVVIGDDGDPQQDGHGNWVFESRPYPVLAERGPAARIGGVLFSELVRREGGVRPGWALTSRQEIHAEAFQHPTVLLQWLSTRAVRFQCHTRFYEDDVLTPAFVRDGELVLST